MRDRYTRYPRTVFWLVPGGEVEIGGAEDDARPTFVAEVEPFYVGQTPITNEQYEAFDPGFERSPLSPEDGDTAVGMSWRDARAYCVWYAEVSRKKIRLPSEVEWEYACRGGEAGRTFFAAELADDPEAAETYVWHAGNSGGQVQRPDAKKSNPFGLYGMLGGVWEWTGSLYAPYPPAREGEAVEAEPASEPDSRPEERVARGGSLFTPRDELSSSARRALDPSRGHPDVGFRIARSFR